MVVLTSFRLPTEGIRHEEPNTTVFMNSNNLGKGILYISESKVAWASSTGSGFSLDYKQISLHAVSRDLSSYPQECLLLLLDIEEEGGGAENGDHGDDGDEDEGCEEEASPTELRFVPEDKGVLDAMFHAMTACQALHPDPQDSLSDEDFYEAVEEDEEAEMEEADTQMSHLNIGQNGNGTSEDMNPGCFEDAEDTPDN